MGFWTDIDEDYVLEFQKWHNCEHMTERTSIPGFHVGRRLPVLHQLEDLQPYGVEIHVLIPLHLHDRKLTIFSN